MDHSEAMKEPEKRSNDIERSIFVNKFQVSFVRLREDVRPSNFGKWLRMPQR